MKRILTIDGGGIRGIIPAKILSYLETEKQKTNPTYRLADSFDLIAGTSTGGIIALGLLVPNYQPNATVQLKYMASDLLNLYVENGSNIFDTNFFKRKLAKVFNETYSATNLEKCLKQYFGEVMLKELIKPCLITTYDTFNRRTWFFNSVDAKQNEPHNFLVRDVARATSAAPTYFETADVKSAYGTEYPFIDGGIFANNPTSCALVELLEMLNTKNEKTAITDIQIISIGTGKSDAKEKRYKYNDLKNWGAIEWASPLIDMMMSASAETVDYQMEAVFKSLGAADNYCRIQPTINWADPEMDNASEENIKNLIQDADVFITKNIYMLNQIVTNVL